MNGFIYAASGQSCLAEFLESYQTLRLVMPDANVTLVTDMNIEVKGVNIINLKSTLPKTHPLEGFLYKTAAANLSPYKKTILLDCDTYVIKQLFRLFDLVDSFDICASLSPYDTIWPRIGNKKLLGFTPVNSGVVCFSDSLKSTAIIRKWGDILRGKIKSSSTRKNEGDQTSLNESIFINDGRLCVLPNNFNLRIFRGPRRRHAPAVVEGEVYILHTHIRLKAEEGILFGESLNRKINSHKLIRGIFIRHGKIVVNKYLKNREL
jgi:hypothetical protein